LEFERGYFDLIDKKGGIMKIKTPVFFIVFACVLGVLIGCAKLTNYLNGSNTSLTSNSLSTANLMRSMGMTVAGSREGSNWLITPKKISGKIMSVVFPVGGSEDEGVVPFGSGRPDIAPANSILYDFDLSSTTTLRKEIISLKPGFKGGKCNGILLMFGYFDVEFLQGTSAKKIRFVYGDSDPYVRGDKLLYNANGAATGKFYWYDTSAENFVIETAVRPAAPFVNTFVRDYSDPIRPNMHYYLLGAQLKNNVDYDHSVKNYITLDRPVVEDTELFFTVDFDVQNCVVFTGAASEAEFNGLSDAQLLQKFDMKQNVSDWRDSNLYCSVSFEAVSKYK
ncbi:MAG: hypothetical protein AABZ57_07710, partial [Candidatus Margulisiibacteriota bacterium]